MPGRQLVPARGRRTARHQLRRRRARRRRCTRAGCSRRSRAPRRAAASAARGCARRDRLEDHGLGEPAADLARVVVGLLIADEDDVAELRQRGEQCPMIHASLRTGTIAMIFIATPRSRRSAARCISRRPNRPRHRGLYSPSRQRVNRNRRKRRPLIIGGVEVDTARTASSRCRRRTALGPAASAAAGSAAR